MAEQEKTEVVTNFGGNLKFTAAEVCRPTSENELLRFLEQNPTRKIRAMGSLHAWSELVETSEVLIDLSGLNQVSVITREGEQLAEIGAGCQLKRALSELKSQAELTLPSLGLITEQTVAGATGTATHGSGKQCLSAYLRSARVITFDGPQGSPVIREIDAGNELDAIRCSLGCLGIVVSVRFETRPCYRVEEHFERYHSLSAVLEQESAFPLQQFFYIPWMWEFFAQHRRETESPKSRSAGLFAIYWLLVFDLGMHLIVAPLARWIRWKKLTQFAFRWIIPMAVVRNWKVVDDSTQLLVMEHQLFRHVEMELFVQRDRLEAALNDYRGILQFAAGDGTLAESLNERLCRSTDPEHLEGIRGQYTHHYPVAIRRIVPDQTMMSMTSGGDDSWFAISLITYDRIRNLDPFKQLCSMLARFMAHEYGARPHWGKYCPLEAGTLKELYPRWSEFAAMRSRRDPSGRLRNRWIDELFGMGDVVA